MSGQWEVVGKKKDKGSNKMDLSRSNNIIKQELNKNKKNNVLNGVKIEEVLPKSQVQNIYGNKIKENKKTQEKPKTTETKKPEKKVNKPQEPVKPKPPKSIESALTLIHLEDFKTIYEKSKSTYPEAPIVWLKELVQFLNQKIPIDIQDPVFSAKPETYPLSAVPSDIKSVIEKSVKEAGRNNAQLYFDIALTSMVTDMSKGLPAVGYKFYLQHIALSEPKLVTANVKKHVTLRSSYQNRANIGLSILWAVGHVGITDFQSGLTVFEELMLPLLEMKSYSYYVVKYLLDLIRRNVDTSTITKEQYLLILDTIFSNKKNCPDVQEELMENASRLKTSLFKNKDKYHSYVETFLKKIARNSDKTYQNCLCDVLVTIFTQDPSTLTNWSKLYAKNLIASAVLLSYIGNNCKTLQKLIRNSAFKEVLTDFITLNEELLAKKRKDDGLRECMEGIKKINETRTESQKKGGYFGSFIKFIFILGSLGIIFETVYKVQQGRAEDSSFRKVNNGIVYGISLVNAHLEQSFPEQHKVIAGFSQPYIELIVDLGKVIANAFLSIKESVDPFVKEKYGVVVAAIDTYAPGLSEQSWTIFNNICTTSGLYYNKSIQYLTKEVFVGHLSPENMQRVVLEAYNTTSHKATEYYHWVCDKVQTAIK